MSDQRWFSVNKGSNYEGDEVETRISITLTFDGIVSGDVAFAELDRIVSEVKRVF